VLWRAEPRGEDKPAKVPYCIFEPRRRASSTDAGTWGTFADAVDAYSVFADRPDPERGPVAGIGVVLTRETRVTCLDLDRVLSAAGLDTRAAQLVAALDSWAEVSPSGTGLHIFVRGTVVRAIKGDQIEVYAEGRFMAVTGHVWPGCPPTLREQQAYLDRLAAHEQPSPRRPWTGARIPPPDDLAGALLAKLHCWGVAVSHVKRWQDGYLVELPACPWADEHTSGMGGAAVMIRASGAFDFTCLHAHCGGRGWRDFRAHMEAS